MKWRNASAAFSASASERGPAGVGFFSASCWESGPTLRRIKRLAGDVCLASVDLAGTAGAGARCE